MTWNLKLETWLPNTRNVVEGIVLLIVGAGIAFMAALRKSRR